MSYLFVVDVLMTAAFGVFIGLKNLGRPILYLPPGGGCADGHMEVWSVNPQKSTSDNRGFTKEKGERIYQIHTLPVPCQ